MKARLLLAAAAIALAPTAAFAQANTVGGAIIGGTVGAATEPPPAVTTYVERERVPSVTVEEDAVVGQPLPRTVKIYSIPKHKEYSYAIVNDRRVIVEPRTRKVIKVIQ